MNHLGMDVHDAYSQICEINEQREVLFEGKVATTRRAFREFFQGRKGMRVILESGPHATWIAAVLEELGHEPVICHARRIRLIAKSRNKNDRVDAELLARLALSDLDLIRPVPPRSSETLGRRSVVRCRATLVQMRTTLRVTLRGLVKPFGIRLRPGYRHLAEDASSSGLPELVRESLSTLLETLDTINRQIKLLEAKIEQLTDQSPQAERLQSIPGVGPVTALSFCLAIEPDRFSRGDVGPFLGLTPPNRSSAGKKIQPGDRARPGDRYLRGLLIQSAWSLMNSRSESDLAEWGRGLSERIGTKKAAVAVARKLAELMHHLLAHEQTFQAHPPVSG